MAGAASVFATTRSPGSIAFFSLMSDPLSYGMAANRPSIDALVTYALQQKLIPSRPQLDQVLVDIDPYSRNSSASE